MEILIQPYTTRPFGYALKSALKGDSGSFDRFSAAVAFVRSSGIKHIENELREFCNKGGKILFIAGIDRQGTSFEGMKELLKLVSECGEVFVNYCTDIFVTFHPKLYFFENQENGLLFVGSGNLTEGGLYLNDEAFLIVKLDFRFEPDREIAYQVNSVFQQWKTGNGLKANSELIQSLLQNDLLIREVPEKIIGEHPDDDPMIQHELPQKTRQTNPEGLFQRSVTHRVTPKKIKAISRKTLAKDLSTPIQIPENEPFEKHYVLGFVMLLQTTDVGIGQITAGKSRRSPEIFIPLAARNLYPEFWGWQDLFTEDTAKLGKFDRRGVACRIGGEVVTISMMTWPVKHDFRLRSEKLRSAGKPGDLLRMEKTTPATGFEYYVEIIPQGTSAYEQYLEFCSEKVFNSDKRWGYYGF